MKKALICETLNDVKTMKVEKTSDGLMRLSGVFGVCGVVNNNKRIYEAGNYKKMVEDLKARIASEGCPGELEHPQTMNICLENVSHKIESIDIDDKGVVTGTIALLNTPKGKIAQAIVEGGLPLFVSSRAQGNVDKDGHVTLETLKTYDLVGTPGFSQARMHLNEGMVAESLSDNIYYITSESNDDNKKTEEIEMTTEQLENLMSEITDLRDEVKTLRRKINETEDNSESQKQLAEGIQSWIENEYTPHIKAEMRNWFVNEAADKIEGWITNEYSAKVNEWVCNEVADGIQKWVTEEYSPKLQQWITEEYSGELQNWLTEEYSETLQNWIVEEYSGKVGEWINEEFGKSIKGWFVNECAPVIEKWTVEEFAGKVNESRESKLDTIDSILKIVESNTGNKPQYKSRMTINENANDDEPMFVKQMPADCVAKWNNASEDVKESIRRRAKIYNLTNEAAIEKFWNNIEWNTIAPAKSIYEGLDEIQDKNEQALRLQLRRFRNN